MTILFEPLRKAHLALVKAVDRSVKNPNYLEVRDACIQRFGYTYELSIKTIKRYLEGEHPLFLQQLSALREAFSNSDLPMRVDIVDGLTVSPEFMAIIKKTPFNYRVKNE
jgi:predicted membrane-bound dolichyl-phosphate-mannose-protein mannosyltransferase